MKAHKIIQGVMYPEDISENKRAIIILMDGRIAVSSKVVKFWFLNGHGHIETQNTYYHF